MRHSPTAAWLADDDPDAPAMMEPGVPAHEDDLARPSLLAFRNSRVLRATQRQSAAYKHQLVAAVYNQPTLQAHHVQDEPAEWYESSEDTEDERGSTRSLSPAPRHTEREGTIASTISLEDDLVVSRDRRATTITAYMDAPASNSSIPIMDENGDRASEDGDFPLGPEDNDVDVIVCDPARLPRTMIVDEHGFSLSRESLLVSAAAFDRSSVIKTGLLFKLGKLRGRLVPSGGWKVRYAALSASKLTFFREENGSRRGEINLLARGAGKCVIEVMPKDSVFDGATATMWRFAIRFGSGNGRRVLLAAYTEAEMKDWLRCLHVALAVGQGGGVGRFTDVVVPSGTFLADKRGNAGPLRASGFH